MKSYILFFSILILILASGCSTDEAINTENTINEQSETKIVYLENTSLEQLDYCKDKSYNCYIEIGILNKERNICYIFKNSGSWNQCHYFMAYIFPEYETCDAITDFKKKQGGLFVNCLKNAARNSQDPSFCNYMEMTPEQKKKFDEINQFGKRLNSDKEACLSGIERNKEKGVYIPHFTDFQEDLISLGDNKTRIKLMGRENPIMLDTYLKIVGYAKQNNNPDICQSNFGSSVGWEPCEMEVITAQNDISKCDYFWHNNGSYTKKVECEISIKKDPSICEEVTTEHTKESCYIYAFNAIDDINSCEKISDTVDKKECLAVLKNDISQCETDKCYMAIALKHENKQACENIEKDSYEYTKCITNTGLNNGNLKVCEILKDEDAFMDCIEDVSEELESSSSCNQLSNNELKEFCIHNSRDSAI